MTKAEVWDILRDQIKVLCISGLTYTDTPCVNMMTAALSEIDSCLHTLDEVMR